MKKYVEKIERECVVCPRKIVVFLYKGGTYRGGHYFGTHTLPALKRGGKKITFEYWECPKCYRE